MSDVLITTKREALEVMARATAERLIRLAEDGYTDSDYDTLENYLDITNQLLSADYECNDSYLPSFRDAPWCPDVVRNFLIRKGGS